jgi:hypothetical protein
VEEQHREIPVVDDKAREELGSALEFASDDDWGWSDPFKASMVNAAIKALASYLCEPKREIGGDSEYVAGARAGWDAALNREEKFTAEFQRAMIDGDAQSMPDLSEIEGW